MQFAQQEFISPKYEDLGPKYTQVHHGYASEPQLKGNEANFFQDKKSNWSAHPFSYYIPDQPKSSALPNESKLFDHAVTLPNKNSFKNEIENSQFLESGRNNSFISYFATKRDRG